MTYVDTESLVQDWLKASYLAPLVTRGDGGVSIFKAMPNASPLPSVVLNRVGGAPARGKDTGEDIARISFDCWASSREQAVTLSLTLVSLIEELGPSGGFRSSTGWLEAAETVSWLWLPDKVSDTARYVVDALFTVLSG